MKNFDFDLENARIKIKNVMDLLGIFREFFNEECPECDVCNSNTTLDAFVFVKRARCFSSVIDAAHDKVADMYEAMGTAIDKYFEDVKKGGEVA